MNLIWQWGRRRRRVAAGGVAAVADRRRRGRRRPTFSASMEHPARRKDPAALEAFLPSSKEDAQAPEAELQSVTTEASPASLVAPARRPSLPSHRRSVSQDFIIRIHARSTFLSILLKYYLSNTSILLKSYLNAARFD